MRPLGRAARRQGVKRTADCIQLPDKVSRQRIDLDAIATGLIFDQTLTTQQQERLQDWLAGHAQALREPFLRVALARAQFTAHDRIKQGAVSLVDQSRYGRQCAQAGSASVLRTEVDERT
jgi:hypothetical protein